MKHTKHPRYTDSVQYSCLEDLRESSIEFSLVHCGKEECNPSFVVHGERDEFILHFILHGKGIYTIHNKSWSLSAGDMFLIYPHTDVTYISDSTDPWEYGWIGFQGILSENILYHCGLSEQEPVSNLSDVEHIFSLIDDILSHRQLTFSNDLYRQGILMQIFSYLIDNNTAQNTNSIISYDYSSNIYVNHAVSFIQKFYADGINVSTIADYIGISRTHLNNSFQKELGTTVQKFIMEIRLHKAANLLSSTTYSIAEIANLVGYSDALAFSKIFKKKFNQSPKFYRNEKQSLDCYD